MTLASRVIAAFKKNPKASSAELAKIVGCHPAYVRTAMRRAGKKLALSDRIDRRTLKERERCADIASNMGHPEIAEAIRRGCEI